MIVNRGCVTPGMLVKHRGLIWTAHANTRGKLCLRRMSETTYTRDLLVEIVE